MNLGPDFHREKVLPNVFWGSTSWKSWVCHLNIVFFGNPNRCFLPTSVWHWGLPSSVTGWQRHWVAGEQPRVGGAATTTRVCSVFLEVAPARPRLGSSAGEPLKLLNDSNHCTPVKAQVPSTKRKLSLTWVVFKICDTNRKHCLTAAVTKLSLSTTKACQNSR